MQQPQSRPLLGDSVSSTTSPTTRRNNSVAVLTPQQLQQLQQLQSQNSGSQSVTFTLQQPSGNTQDQSNGAAAGNHILYLNQLNQLNQGHLNPSGTGMGLPQATPTFGVGLNMGLPLSLLNTSLASLTSNAITTSNSLLNLSLPSINSGLTAINPSLNQLSTLGTNLNSSLSSDSINNGLSNLGQDLSSMNRLGALNSTGINSGLNSIGAAGLTSVNPSLTSLSATTINQNLASINANLNATNSASQSLNTNLNISTNNINSALNQQGLNRPLNTITSLSSTNGSAQFPFQTIQGVQSLASNLVGSSIVVSSSASQNQNSNVNSMVQPAISNSSSANVSSTCVSSSSGPIIATSVTTTNATHSNNQQINVAQFEIMTSNMSNVLTSQVNANDSSTNPSLTFRQFTNQNLNQSSINNSNQVQNAIISNMKTVQGIQQNQSNTSPSSPFSIPMKSPASSIAPPTPSPSPNRFMLRSPVSNSVQQSRNSPSPVSTLQSNTSFNVQLHSPMQSPMSVGQIHSPVPSPYPPAKSPHLSGVGASMNNKSPAPVGSPSPSVVRPSTPIVHHQQGMQVLQIIHGPQGYQATPQLVRTTHLFGNQQIQIATPAKQNKQPPQILPKPPLQQTTSVNQQKQRIATTVTNQVTQQSQPQIVLAGHQQNPSTAMIPTAQGLLLNQVLPSSGPVIVQQQAGGVQLILRAPTNAQQQTHTAQLTQQQLVRVVTAQGMQLQGITPTFFAVPNGFSSPAPHHQVIRHTPSSPAPTTNQNNNNSGIVIQNTMVPNSQSQMAQPTTASATAGSIQQSIIDQGLLPPPKKKAKKKKRAKKKEDEHPRLDLASIMKISGIGDDDDIFDNDLTTEMETTPQPQGEVMQNSLVTSVQQNVVQQVPAASSASNLVQDNAGQLIAQVETPVPNTISGQLRLAIDENGRIVLHHTADPNQPEMDQATAQALIKSLTQGGGQNSQIISQLLQSQPIMQMSQNSNANVQKSVKSPIPTTPSAAPSLTNLSNLQNSNALLVQNNLQNFNSSQTAMTVASPNTQSTANVASQNVGQSAKSITVTRRVIDAKKPTAVDFKSNLCQNSHPPTPNQVRTIAQQVIKYNQPKIQNISINQQKSKQQVEIQVQKTEQSCTNVQRTFTLVKSSPNQPQTAINSIQEGGGSLLPQNSIIYHQNASHHHHIPTSQHQNIQNMFEQGLQQSVASNLQRTSADGMKIEMLNIHNQPQQQTTNLFQQNSDGSISSIAENNLQFINDAQLPQHQNAQLNANNAKQQPAKTLDTNPTASNQPFEMQNLPSNVFISNASAAPTVQQQMPKSETHNLCNSSTPATAVMNNGPKITPDILNALSNLNPNDQLLIAFANGQMQVMSQQVLQQFITSQINTQMQAQIQAQPQHQPQNHTQNQNQSHNQHQTQKIVIGDPDSSNPNLQEVQINTPTSQIIVNSSGGAPTIQNNIQNIVVQASPTQVPQQIQIQNSGFPTQFIDNLNQQQLRNFGNCTTQTPTSSQNVNQSCAPKKPKIVKKAKVLTVQSTAGKSPSVAKPSIVTTTLVTTTTTTTTSASPQVKPADPANKMINFLAQVVDSNKNESPQLVTVNGPLTALSPGQMPTLAPGQVVHRVQTIQLTAQKQQLLSSNQAQIRTLQARKNPSQADQLVIAKLFQEQTRILASGKVIGNSQHPISSEPEATANTNVVKSLPLTVQTQPPAPTNCPSNVTTSHHIHIATSLPVSSGNIYLTNITNQRVSSPRPSTPLKPQHSQPQRNQNQVENGQVLVPSNANLINADSLNSHGMILESQQLTACHEDAIDVKPNIELAGPVIKQEFPSHFQQQQQQIQNSSPAGQVMSPRLVGKTLQISQNKLPSPDNPSASPKQGVKRNSDSTPVCRPPQVNRADLFEQQLKIDQNGALNPDVNTPFQSKSDACKRLVRYHCFNDHVLSTKDLEKADEIFEETAKHLLSKFNSMMNKYTYLLIMESMRETRTSELMMIDRMIVNEEQSTLSKMREQEAKLAVEMKTEEKLLVPKMEPNDEGTASTSCSTVGMSSSTMTTPTAPVKLELEMEVGLGKSADYDEWFEIQKELGAYTSTEFKCRTRANRVERARANGQVGPTSNEASASDLERDLLEDTESLEALYTQCPVQAMEQSANPDEHDDITAQVQSAIDSILSLKKRPASGGASQQQGGGSSSSSSDSNDKLLDQAVRSILGS